MSKDLGVVGEGGGLNGFFSIYLLFLLYLSLVIQGIHKTRSEIQPEKEKGKFQRPHQHSTKWKWNLSEELADEVLQIVPESLFPVDSLCAGMWEYYKQQ